MRPLVMLFTVVCLAGCGRTAQSGPPDILLVLLPGMRADLPGAEGGSESMLIDALGPPRVHYTAAMSQSPYPYASLASLLTGMYPSAIPICNRLPNTDKQPWCTEIPTQRYTLQSILSVYGYSVGAVHGKMEGANLFGDHHEEVPGRAYRADWQKMAVAAKTWWDAAPSPRFLVVAGNDLNPDELPPADEARATRAYNERSREMAAGVARVVANIDAQYIFVTSTHGVSLVEKTGLRAGHDLFLSRPTNGAVLDRTVHVPLLVYGPEGPSETISDVVELVDLVPTICALAGATAPANTPGTDLFNVGTDNRGYAEFGDWLALREGQWLFTFRSYLHNGSSLDPENTLRLKTDPLSEEYFSLHDVLADPLQTQNVVMANLQMAQQMRERLLTVRTTLGAAPPDMLPNDKVEQIRLSPSQGYW